MGFKDFCNNAQKNEQKINTNEEKNIEEVYEKYKNKSQDELIEELFKNVNEQKQNGTFNYEGLKNTIQKVSPFLTREQNLKLKELLGKLN